MQIDKIAFAGNTAEMSKAHFIALKKKYPHLSNRGIYCLIASELKKSGMAIRLGFDTSESEVAR